MRHFPASSTPVPGANFAVLRPSVASSHIQLRPCRRCACSAGPVRPLALSRQQHPHLPLLTRGRPRCVAGGSPRRKDVPIWHVGCVWVQSWLLSMAAEKPYSCLLAARRAAADGAPQQRRARQMRGRRLAGAAAAAWRHHPHEGPSATESVLLVHLHEVFAAHALKPTWMAAAAWPVTLPQPFEACEVDDAVADVAKVMQRRWVPAMHPRCKHFFSASTIELFI